MAVKLGNGNWAVKEDKLLAYNDNSGLFFNKEFDFSRGTSATYVAKDGLIKTAGIQPNIVNNGDFATDSDWNLSNAAIEDGVGKFQESVGTYTRIRQNINFTGQTKVTYTISFNNSSKTTIGLRSYGGFNSEVIALPATVGTHTVYEDFASDGVSFQTGGLAAGEEIHLDNVSVQEIQTDTPRIDFTNDTKGHLLLEPSRTNLLTYSEDFTQWDKNSGTTITSNSVISPDGTQNATKIVSAGTGSRVGLNTSIVSGTTYTLSVYLKNNGGNTSVSIGSHGTTQLETVTINNEWNRYTTTFVASSTTTSSIRINSSGSNINLYAWGAQVEAGSYATSYIPTTGATSTRNADVCNNSGSAQDFNSEEGVLYAEIAALYDDLTSRVISISDGTTAERVQIAYQNVSNRIKVFVFSSSNGDSLTLIYNATDITDFVKVAVKYKSGDYALWVDGIEVQTKTKAFTPSGLNSLQFDSGSGAEDFYGKVRNVQVFTEALTDEQLEKLTS